MTSRMAALWPTTCASQRSADACCDRTEIITPFLCRAKVEPIRAGNVSLTSDFGPRLQSLGLSRRRGDREPSHPFFRTYALSTGAAGLDYLWVGLRGKIGQQGVDFRRFVLGTDTFK